ncbi:protein translocase subunit SecF [Sulfuricurvum sp.]|uniref:protein translocase subunit SecF n=1 Tax=Sulfuricurvum sp. TaxID=2025608 RepID=UPI002631836F|nr:protein translocase subunit SecF [Sulfuricurvum sp.]MDD2780826.1 protein translocase subunit SecF [Sulfuricurvum sp.]
MELFKAARSIPFMGKSKIAIIISIIMVLGSYALIATKGFNFGIDFVGGTIVQVKYEGTAPIDEMRTRLSGNAMFEGSSINEFGSPDEVVIRLKSSSESVTQDIGDAVREKLAGTGQFEIRRVDIVGAKVGSELREKGIMSLTLAMIGILIYVAFRFEWRFAVASVLALVHDISIAMGAIALIGLDVNLDVLAALLTVLGYSINDTIIVFDRIREGITDSKETSLVDIIDESITKTLSRTTLTSLTTLLVVVVLFLFGGEIIHAFAFTLLVGIGVGTYSSIFVASPILQWFGFDVKNYRAKLSQKAARQAEKERLRAQFEQGVV